MYVIEVEHIHFNTPRWDLFTVGNSVLWHTDHLELAKTQAHHLITDLNLVSSYLTVHVIDLDIRAKNEKQAKSKRKYIVGDEIVAKFFKDKIGT